MTKKHEHQGHATTHREHAAPAGEKRGETMSHVHHTQEGRPHQKHKGMSSVPGKK